MTARTPHHGLLAAAAVAGASLAIAVPDGRGPGAIILIALLGSLLAVGAVIDRQEGVAPDLIAGPILPLALAAGTLAAPGNMSPLEMILLGSAMFLALNMAWIPLDRLTGGRVLPPPADLAAIAIPALSLGLTPLVSAFYFCCALVAFLCLRIPRIRAIFTDEKIAETLRIEITDEDRPALAGLALLYPAIWALFCISLGSG